MFEREKEKGRMSTIRTPPSWFARELRNLSPRLHVFWNNLKHVWEIAEEVTVPVKQSKNKWGIAYVYTKQLEKVMYAPSLGSGILTQVRRNKISRYRSLEEFDLDTTVKNYM